MCISQIIFANAGLLVHSVEPIFSQFSILHVGVLVANNYVYFNSIQTPLVLLHYSLPVNAVAAMCPEELK